VTRRCGLTLGIMILILFGLAAAPAGAQVLSHGAGVNWSGTHGGVNWDGGHAYEGGSYGGYPASSAPRPAYQMPQPTPYPMHEPRTPYAQNDSSDHAVRHDDRRSSPPAVRSLDRR